MTKYKYCTSEDLAMYNALDSFKNQKTISEVEKRFNIQPQVFSVTDLLSKIVDMNYIEPATEVSDGEVKRRKNMFLVYKLSDKGKLIFYRLILLVALQKSIMS